MCIANIKSSNIRDELCIANIKSSNIRDEFCIVNIKSSDIRDELCIANIKSSNIKYLVHFRHKGPLIADMPSDPSAPLTQK
ncbi:hypothetical protein Btru_024336 [Bulinus truncatus]|nr:hypothetical protein Btru_024336 [Bulinus truncatus]